MALKLILNNFKGADWTKGWRNFEINGVPETPEKEKIYGAISNVLLKNLEQAYQEAFKQGKLNKVLEFFCKDNSLKEIKDKKRYYIKPGEEIHDLCSIESRIGIYSSFEGFMKHIFGHDLPVGSFDYYYRNEETLKKYPFGKKRVVLNCGEGDLTQIELPIIYYYERGLKQKVLDGSFEARLKQEIERDFQESKISITPTEIKI